MKTFYYLGPNKSEIEALPSDVGSTRPLYIDDKLTHKIGTIQIKGYRIKGTTFSNYVGISTKKFNIMYNYIRDGDDDIDTKITYINS